MRMILWELCMESSVFSPTNRLKLLIQTDAVCGTNDQWCNGGETLVACQDEEGLIES